MCWDSDISWSRLEDQLKSMEKGVQGPQSSGPIRCQELWDDGWSGRVIRTQSDPVDPSILQSNVTCNSVRS